jgi:predicted metal-dependent phosphoesterase TrpH
MNSMFNQRPMTFGTRVDLHCHSRASTEADEAVLQAIHCPESYSEPGEIHAQAKQRHMDFVTITDHDSISGVEQLAHMPDVFVGEELTCYFPEDHCKIHLLLWGITPAQHHALQASANDIYEIAIFVAEHRIAHSVAHPLYRQNGVLDRWHIERLLLIFKGFECLNGAHSMSHRQVFEPLLDELDAAEIRRLESAHGIDALWPTPWIKARTGGSDDHGLFNIGRTWTEFPGGVQSVEEILESLRVGRCEPGGEAGSSIKLAHNFFSVGMRYYTRQIAPTGRGFKSAVMKRMLGEKPSSGKIAMASGVIGWSARSLLGRIGRKLRLKKPARGTDLLHQLLTASAMKRFDRRGVLSQALRQGQSPMAEHQPMFDWICNIDRDVVSGIVDSLMKDVGAGSLGGIIDTLSTVVGHQAILLPYYFALFHQNQERDLLGKLAQRSRTTGSDTLRVGLFTDITNENDPAGRFAHQFARFAESRGLHGIVHTISQRSEPESKCRRNFTPMVDRQIEPLPFNLVIPPVLEILEWSDRQQFDAVLINSCGPMGLCGWLTAKMLRAPMLAVCHEDLPARVLKMTGGDYRLASATSSYVDWLYRGAAKVLVASREGREAAMKIRALPFSWLSPSNGAESAWNACALAASFDLNAGPASPKDQPDSQEPMEVVTL